MRLCFGEERALALDSVGLGTALAVDFSRPCIRLLIGELRVKLLPLVVLSLNQDKIRGMT